MNKKIIGFSAVIAAGIVGLLLLKCGRQAIGPGSSAAKNEPPLAPVEISIQANGKAIDSIVSGAQGTIHIAVKEKSFVYLFDEYQSAVTVIGEHEGEAWDPGEFEADLPQGRDPGTHTVWAVNSPTKIDVSKWSVIHPDAVHETCKRCSVSEVKIDVMPVQSRQ